MAIYAAAVVLAFVAIVVPVVLGRAITRCYENIVSALTVVLMLFATTASTRAQTGTVTPTADIYGRPGWVLENGTIRVSLLRGGGHIAELRLVSTNPRLSINPMFIPIRTTATWDTLSAFRITDPHPPMSAPRD